MRALFERLPRLEDLVPFMALADGLPTPVDEIAPGLSVKRDDRSSTRYGGNKVRKLEFLLPVALRRGGPLVTAGGTGSHHVVAAAVYARELGLEVEAVLYPQPPTDDVARTQRRLDELGVRVTAVSSRYLMPFALAARMAALAPRRPYLLWPGASTPLGTLGYVSAALELVASGVEEPDDVIVPLGSGGTAVGMGIGLAVGGWTKARVVAVRAADATVTNRGVLGALEMGTSALLAAAGWRPRLSRLDVDVRYFGGTYGAPTERGVDAQARAAALGVVLEPTYTAKAFACALDRVAADRRVVFVNTFAGPAGGG